jgi:hypothetical protein
MAPILHARRAPGCHAPDDRVFAPLDIQNENVAVLVPIQPTQRMQPIELGSVRAEHLIGVLGADQQYPAFHGGILGERRPLHSQKSENLRQQARPLTPISRLYLSSL